MITQNTEKLAVGHLLNHTAIKVKETGCVTPRIVDFSVTTDSVVARALVVTDRNTHFIEVDWGDGQTSNISLSYASRFKIPAYNGENALQQGTYEFYHRYDVSYVPSIFSPDIEHPAPMDYLVVLKTIDFNGDLDISIRDISIEPAYRINFYQLVVGLKNQCDGGSLNEFTITQTENGSIQRDWSWSPSDNVFFAFPTYVIPNSQLSQVFTVNDAVFPTNTAIPDLRFNFVEHDAVYDDRGSLPYDRFLRQYLNGRQDNAAGRLEGEISVFDSNPVWGSSCKLMYAFDWELTLVVPLPSSQPGLFTDS